MCLFSPIFAQISPTVESIELAVQKKQRDTKTKEALAKYLTDAGTPILVKERAAWAIGALDLKSQVKSLQKAAQNKSLLVRSAALDSLIRMRASSTYSLLIETAKHDPIFQLRIKSIIGLGLLKKADAIPTLVSLAQDKNEEIRGVVCLAMAAHQSKKNDFKDALTYMAKDKSAFVQERAHVGLNIVQKNASALTQSLGSEDDIIRLFSAQYFHYYGGEKDLKNLQAQLSQDTSNDVKLEIELAMKGIQNRAREEAKRRAQAAKTRQPSGGR